MLHHIIVKWNANVDKEAAAQKVHLLYAAAAKIPGIQQVEMESPIRQKKKKKVHLRLRKPDNIKNFPGKIQRGFSKIR